MKLAFISDIHGNSIALRAVLEDMKTKSIDHIYVLGDLCYRGPDPQGSLDAVMALDTEVIRGNADEWVVRGIQQGEVPESMLERMNAERDWTVSQLRPQAIEYLKELPVELNLTAGNYSIHAFHATPESLFEIVLPELDDEQLAERLMSAVEADVYIYAHIHKPYIRYIHGKILINTGSVGLPFDGMAKASYAIIEVDQHNIRTSIERVAYDIEAVIQHYEGVEYPNLEMMSRIVRRAKMN